MATVAAGSWSGTVGSCRKGLLWDCSMLPWVCCHGTAAGCCLGTAHGSPLLLGCCRATWDHSSSVEYLQRYPDTVSAVPALSADPLRCSSRDSWAGGGCDRGGPERTGADWSDRGAEVQIWPAPPRHPALSAPTYRRHRQDYSATGQQQQAPVMTWVEVFGSFC